MATQGNSCKLPILKKHRHHLARPALPKKFKSATFMVVFVHLIVRCTRALCPTTLVAFPKRVPWPTIPPRDRPLKDEEATSSAIICKPNKAQALNVAAMSQNSTAFVLGKEKKKELAIRPVLLRHIPDAGCRAQTHDIPRIQKRPHPFPPRPVPHFLQYLCTNHIGRHPRGQRYRPRTCVTRTI